MTSATTSPPSWSWRGAIDKNVLRGEGLSNVSRRNSLLFSAFRRWQRKPDVDPLTRAPASVGYSVARGAQDALERLSQACQAELPQAIISLRQSVEVTSTPGGRNEVHFPTPLKEQDATAAIKALEACAAAAIANIRYGTESRKIHVDIDKVSTFLLSAYLTTLDGMGKADARIKERIPDTDLNQAQSILYRRLSANLYSTKNPGEFYHIHGSLDASVTLKMLGLPTHNTAMTDYRESINYIEAAVKKHTAKELDDLNVKHRQAGIQALTWEQFQRTPHGKALTHHPPLTVRPNPHDTTTPPIPFPSSFPAARAKARTPRGVLTGIKVLELCRIIAGPTIGRSLAAHGAQVLKVTSPHLPDVPFFQLDVNTGKHAIHLDLTNPHDKQTFDALLADTDVLIDGYRPGALARLGYSPAALGKLASTRGRGIVYVAEDCFGSPTAPAATEWSGRAGWQQIADCVTGVAWAQGRFMGLAEPVVPPFPMSDYGTGALGSAAALAGLYRRATEGGSWVCRTSLCQYDVFLMGLGELPREEQERLRAEFGSGGGAAATTGEGEGVGGFFGLRHSDSVDEVGKRALAGMRRVVPQLFDEQKMMHAAWSEGFQGVVKWPREAVQVDGLRIGHVRTARPNGFDGVAAGWEEWEEDVTVEAANGK
ncbi:CoA-transferase family III [Trichocladium antarcticum]|uniref:CoA-transferase family III n=1 Tax=Trichocladium antarcticum TaxID=1450529 RepID=A0AAN6URA5_9PEZI|nr:CoA-transferase family III [Trichocladium antarcticum]